MKVITNKAVKMYEFFKFSIFLCLVFLPVSLYADKLTEQQVRAAVQTWVRYVTADADPNAFIEQMESYKDNGEAVAYIAHISGGGFCLCGADDLVVPVYLYSPQGAYDPENPNFQYILWEINVRTENLTQASRQETPAFLQYQQTLAARASYWQELIAGIVPESITGLEGSLAAPRQMELDLTSRWRQGSPYNDRCPELTPGADEHTVVGCTATAMSQLMYYWKWPNTGQGNNSVYYSYWWRTGWIQTQLASDPGIPGGWTGRLEWVSTSGGQLRMNGYWDMSLYTAAQAIDDDPDYQSALSTLWGTLQPGQTYHYANFGDTTYDWSIIQDDHRDPVDAGDAEVAKLCYHAGVAVSMNYGIKESGSLLSSELEDYFRYDPDAYVATANHEDTLIQDIQWLRPVVISGWKPPPEKGGHAWVIFGYNTGTNPTQFLMNMGWGGSPVWYSLDDSGLPYTLQQQLLAELAPLNVVKFVGNSGPGDGSPHNPYQDILAATVSAPYGATLIFKAGSTNTFPGSSLTINRPCTLKGRNVTIW